MGDNEPKINDGAYVISLDDKKVMEHIGFCYSLTKNMAVYIDSFGIEYILQEVLNKIKNNPSLITYLDIIW